MLAIWKITSGIWEIIVYSFSNAYNASTNILSFLLTNAKL